MRRLLENPCSGLEATEGGPLHAGGSDHLWRRGNFVSWNLPWAVVRSNLRWAGKWEGLEGLADTSFCFIYRRAVSCLSGSVPPAGVEPWLAFTPTRLQIVFHNPQTLSAIQTFCSTPDFFSWMNSLVSHGCIWSVIIPHCNWTEDGISWLNRRRCICKKVEILHHDLICAQFDLMTSHFKLGKNLQCLSIHLEVTIELFVGRHNPQQLKVLHLPPSKRI